MKTKAVSLFLLLLLGFAGPAWNARAQADATEKIGKMKQQGEELRQARIETIRKGFSSGAIQKELDQLNAKRVDLEKELEYVRVKLTGATRDLNTATQVGDRDQIDRRSREAATWEARLKTADVELAKVNADIQALIKKLQDELTGGGGAGSNIILPGDSLQIFVLEDESFNGLYQVRRGGYVILPRVGRVFVAGKDLTGAEKALKDALEQTQLRQGTVMVERTPGSLEDEATEVIYLAGEFTTPGPMRIPKGFAPTIVTTYLRSGGVTKSGDLTRVKLLRLEGGRGLVEEVNVAAILDGVGLQSDLSLNAGDIIVVPANAPVIYVTGNVKNPGIQQLFTDEQLTAYSAILRAGGFARFAKLRGVYILRDLGNGDKTRINVDIKGVQSGKKKDEPLHGLDIVVVPESFFSW